MENNEEIRKEDKIDIKSALSKLVDEEPKELSQEEAIMSYKEAKKKKLTANSGDDAASNQEEEEHLKRVKQELLSSLKRVDDLAKKIFVDKEIKQKNIDKMKMDSSGNKKIQLKSNETKPNEINSRNADEERTIE